MAGLLRRLTAPALVYNLCKPRSRCGTPRGDSRSNKPQAPQPRSSPAARAISFQLPDRWMRTTNRQTHIVARAAVGSAPRDMPVEQLPVPAKDASLVHEASSVVVSQLSEISVKGQHRSRRFGLSPSRRLIGRYLNRGRSGDNWRSDRPAQGRRLPRNRVLYPGKANTPTDASSSQSGLG